MWYTSPAAAAIFRDNPRRLSLLLHGVTHVSNEMARECTQEAALAILAAGLRKVERFEDKTGLSVARVIAAPHGAFTDHFASAMELLEFEGACVSLGSLLRWNPQRSWPANAGSSFAQAMGDGALPVFHRIGPSEVEIRLHSYLGHPIIVTAHHQDCVMNYNQFERVAGTINGICKTKWCSIGEIAQSNYYSQNVGNTLKVFLYSRHASIDLLPGMTNLDFRPTPWCTTGVAVSLDELRGTSNSVKVNNLALNWNPDANRAVVRVIPLRTISPSHLERPAAPLWPFIRRFLTESRDRVLPALSSLSRAK